MTPSLVSMRLVKFYGQRDMTSLMRHASPDTHDVNCLSQGFDQELNVTLKLHAAPWFTICALKQPVAGKFLVLKKKSKTNETSPNDIKLRVTSDSQTNFLQHMWEATGLPTEQMLSVEHSHVVMSADVCADLNHHENQLKFSLTMLRQNNAAAPESKHQLKVIYVNDGGYSDIDTAIAGTEYAAAVPEDRRTWAIHLQLGEHHVHRYASKRMQFKSYQKSSYNSSCKQGLDELEIPMRHVNL
jgi:hypothetical protein